MVYGDIMKIIKEWKDQDTNKTYQTNIVMASNENTFTKKNCIPILNQIVDGEDWLVEHDPGVAYLLKDNEIDNMFKKGIDLVNSFYGYEDITVLKSIPSWEEILEKYYIKWKQASKGNNHLLCKHCKIAFSWILNDIKIQIGLKTEKGDKWCKKHQERTVNLIKEIVGSKVLVKSNGEKNITELDIIEEFKNYKKKSSKNLNALFDISVVNLRIEDRARNEFQGVEATHTSFGWLKKNKETKHVLVSSLDKGKTCSHELVKALNKKNGKNIDYVFNFYENWELLDFIKLVENSTMLGIPLKIKSKE